MFKNSKFLSILMGCMLIVLAGCSSTGSGSDAKKAKRGPDGRIIPPMDFLVLISSTPKAPAKLKVGNAFKLRVGYGLASVEKASVAARGLFGGKTVTGAKNHATIKVYQGSGVADAWFSFDKPAKIDQVRLTLTDSATRKQILVVTNDLKAVWSK